MRYRRSLTIDIAALVGITSVAATIVVQASDRTAARPSRFAEAAPFLAEQAAAMDKMMAAMAVKPTGDVDVDFVAMMIPHHQGAIDMALAVLRYGKNEQIWRLAQEIIVEQQQEIVAMRLAVGQPLLPSAPAPTQPGSAPAASSAAHDHTAMSMPAGPEPK